MSLLKSFVVGYLGEASVFCLMLLSAAWTLLGLSDPLWWFAAPVVALGWGIVGWIFHGRRAGIAGALGFMTIVWIFFAVSDANWRWAAPVFVVAWGLYIWTGRSAAAGTDNKDLVE